MSNKRQRQVYRSTVLGNIPLSFTARHLMQQLRDCIEDSITNSDYECNGKALSLARAKLAVYISELETTQDA